jgi:hypothetical protein
MHAQSPLRVVCIDLPYKNSVGHDHRHLVVDEARELRPTARLNCDSYCYSSDDNTVAKKYKIDVPRFLSSTVHFLYLVTQYLLNSPHLPRHIAGHKRARALKAAAELAQKATAELQQKVAQEAPYTGRESTGGSQRRRASS